MAKEFLGDNRDLLEVKVLLEGYKHLEQSKDLVGYQYKKENGHIDTVVGYDKETKKYILHCSYCSVVDPELWPKGSIQSLKCNIIKRNSCGCSLNPKWKEWQNIIRVKRKCESLGYIFHGWSENYKGWSTHLDLENPSTGNRWTTTHINNLFNGKGDPVQARINTTKASTIPVDIHIKEIRGTGVFDQADQFFRLKANKWIFICDKCSKDKYTLNGLCTGVFETALNTLKNGNKPCRCGRSVSYTKSQREYQIKEICGKEGLTFIDWCDGYKDCDSYFFWRCPKGHKCKTSVDKFVNGGRRCRRCRDIEQGCNGYYPRRKKEQDWLYLQLSSKWVKCGRSFQPSERIKQNSSSSNLNIEEIALYSANHKTVYELEQFIRDLMEEEGLNYYPLNEYPWSGCRECYDNSQKNIDRIRSIIHDSPLEIIHEDGF